MIKRIRRFFRRLLVGLLGLVLLAGLLVGIALLYVIRSPYPETAGELTLSGLQDEVRVVRDAHGIPQIYANNEHDLYFAQGYTHAQDRFWQMEFWRHIGMGRLSEIVGEATLDTDKFIRNLGWNRIAEETAIYYEQNEPELWASLTAYSAGVNAYLAEHGDNMSFNQRVLGVSAGKWEIEPWTPTHSVAWGIVMAWDLRGASNMNAEQLRMDMLDALGVPLASRLFPTYPDNRPIIAPSTQSGSSLNLPVAVEAWQRVNRDTIGAIPEDGFALGNGPHVGSNNWVVSGAHTASGLPLLANDPHLGVQMPSIWYMVGLHAPSLDVVGFSFAGVPGIVVGHNEQIAWGVTNLGADSQDVYIEKVNPNNPLQYEFKGEWRSMDVIEETIKINGGDDVKLLVRTTHHGPLLNNIDPELDDSLAVNWTAFEPSRLFKSIYMLNRATNFVEFREALRYWDTSAQNVVYADKQGHIGYQATGRYPVRNGWDGQTPVPGWTGEFEWEEWIPFDAMPTILDPESGYIVTANHAVVDGNFPYLLSKDWADGDRAQRITDLIEAAIAEGDVSAETYKTIQNDSYDLLFDSYKPLLATLSSDDTQVKAALELFASWDGQMRTDSVAGAIFQLFTKFMGERLITDNVGEEGAELVRNSSHMRILLHEVAARPEDSLWDDIGTGGSAETQSDILLLALDDAVDWLEAEFGKDMDDWTWGAIHQVTFKSNPLGLSGISQLESLVNRGPVPVDGGGSIVNANAWSWDNPAEVSWHPSMRMIIDVSDFSASEAIHPTGQSGHPFHRNYADMIDLWATGQYVPFVFGLEEEEIGGDSAEILILSP